MSYFIILRNDPHDLFEFFTVSINNFRRVIIIFVLSEEVINNRSHGFFKFSICKFHESNIRNRRNTC